MIYLYRFIYTGFAFFLVGMSFFSCTAFAATYDLSGRVSITKVIDGDSLRSGHLQIRLYGIDAPELKQQCMGQNGALWRCGAAAQLQLKALINANKELKCRLRDVDRYGRLVMQCFTGSIDIGKAMVRSGYALAYRHFSELYIEDEERAKIALQGVWRGKFSPPWEWRRQK